MSGCPLPISLCSGTLESLLSSNVSRHFAAASLEVRCQTGRSSSTTRVSPAAPPLPHQCLARRNAQTGCKGQNVPMCPLWGRGGHQYQAPQEPGCRMGKGMKVESRDNEWMSLALFINDLKAVVVMKAHSQEASTHRHTVIYKQQ